MNLFCPEQRVHGRSQLAENPLHSRLSILYLFGRPDGEEKPNLVQRC